MKDTVRLGRIAGVNVGLHWSLLLIGGLLAGQLAGRRFPANAPNYSNGSYLVAAVATAVVFLGCVLAHELSHAVVARRRGIGVDGITLWFLGGATRMTSDPTTPMAELAVAGAGPLTSFVLGAVMVGFGIGARVGGASPLLVDALMWLGVINLVLAVFNALPGAPLDGGRVLHAFVWNRHDDERRATRVASRAGEILGTILIVFGVFEFAFAASGGAALWIAFVGWFLRTAARAEPADGDEDVHFALEGSTVADVMTRYPLVVGAGVSVGVVLDTSVDSRSQEIFPVQSRDGTLVGVVSARQLRLVPRAQRRTTRVGDIVQPLSELRTVGPDEPATVLLEATERDGNGLALVLDADRLVGTVRRSDLARVARSRT